jgi:hypothetical protein
MKRYLALLLISSALIECASAQNAPPPGYGTMGVAPQSMYSPPPSVPQYPNAVPPYSVSPSVSPPPPYADPYAAPPPPGAMSPMPPPPTGSYGSPPPGAYGGPADTSYGAATTGGIVNYNYLEFQYRFIQPKAKGLDGANAIGGTLSVALFEPLYLKFGASWGSGKGGGVAGATNDNYDFATVQAGVGFHTQLVDPRLQFVGEAGVIYASLKATNSTVGFSDGAIYVRPGLRFSLSDAIELQAGVTVSSANKYDSKVFDVAGYFRVMPRFDIGVGADFGDVTRGFRGNLRLRW